MIATRASSEQYNPPYYFYTDDRLRQFVETSLGGKTLNQFAIEMEGFAISGMKCKSSVRSFELYTYTT